MKAMRIGVALAAMLLGGGVASAEQLQVPGSPVSMDVPDGFSAASAFSGFENRSTGSTIVVVEFPPEGFAEISPIFADVDAANAALKAQQVTIDSAETVATATGSFQLLHGEQQVGNATVGKWLALTGPEPTVMLTLNVIDGDPLAAEAVRKMLASVEIGAPLTIEEELAALPYSIGAKAPFTHVTTLGGTAVSLTTAEGPDPSGTLPFVILGWQIGGPSGQAAADIAEPMLRGTVGFADVTIDTVLPASFVGGVGVKHGGTYERAGTAMRFVQYVAVVGGAAVRLLATMKADEAEALLPMIEAIAQSVRRQ